MSMMPPPFSADPQDDGIPAADPGPGAPPTADGFGIGGEEPDRPEEPGTEEAGTAETGTAETGTGDAGTEDVGAQGTHRDGPADDPPFGTPDAGEVGRS